MFLGNHVSICRTTVILVTQELGIISDEQFGLRSQVFNRVLLDLFKVFDKVWQVKEMNQINDGSTGELQPQKKKLPSQNCKELI